MRWVILCAALALPAQASEIAPDGLDNLPGADVYFLGEVHDHEGHHLNQARAIRTIDPAAMVFEMLTEAQATAAPASWDSAEDLGAALEWAGNGWPDFAMYFPIFEAAPDARIYGAAVPRDVARAAFGQPLAEVFAGDAARFGLDQPLASEDQTAREALQQAAHCNALPDEMLPGMVDIQRLRDAELARVAELALRDTGGPVVVITGTGHVRRDWGAPAALAVAAPEVSSLTLGQYELAAPEPPLTDLWIVTDAVAREDPCAAFQ
ncbi:ChaN family lipoprotein [Roseibaca sp. Y0-43]|uniref:ChaN family lipoprotein n=1 Tax=Roseibaca sp. Y0-43 TaxID=2816854 RepID=UPI001D0C6FB5|nr:ChaN family lipoprotein [Roseibaca sp. Y0-43]MCC1481737.1 ChaN family lipoprotein [Roseibaca sp. Y0-43]